jgi:uncharacterized membrane protein
MEIGHTLTLLLHLAGLALWLGGIVFFLMVLRPAVNEAEPGIAIRAINRARVSFETTSWTGIGLLVATGLAGLFWRQPGSGFYWALLSLKLLLFAAMALHHCLQVFKYGRRIALLTAQAPLHADDWPEALRMEWEKWFTLLKINAGLGPIATLMGLKLMGY